MYQDALEEEYLPKGTSIEFTTASALGVEFPDLVNMNQLDTMFDHNLSPNDQAWKMIDMFNSTLGREIVNNKANRKRISRLIKMNLSPEQAYWLVGGYLTFDHLIPGLAGENGIYITAERLNPLFSTIKLTPEAAEVPRIEVLA